MARMSIDDLCGILAVCAGDGAGAPRGDLSDVKFDELGYDSLILIEAAATIKRDHGLVVPDDKLLEARTPGQLLDLINDRIEA